MPGYIKLVVRARKRKCREYVYVRWCAHECIVCVYVCIHISVYIYMYIQTCIYIHVYNIHMMYYLGSPSLLLQNVESACIFSACVMCVRMHIFVIDLCVYVCVRMYIHIHMWNIYIMYHLGSPCLLLQNGESVCIFGARVMCVCMRISVCVCVCVYIHTHL